MIFCPVNDNAIWRTRYTNELYTLHNEPDIVIVVKTERMGWVGHPFKCKNWTIAGSCLYTLHNEPDIVIVVKTERRRWVGHPFKCKNWTIAGSCLYLHQKALDV